MPIYEFYCQDCHTIYNFFSARIDTTASPNCPRCGKSELPRRPSRFATLKHGGEEEPESFGEIDDARLEGAMETLMQEAGGLEENEDPRAMGRLMRRFSELTGLELGPPMEDYVARLEAGGDPEALEAELESSLGDDEAGFEEMFQLKKALQSQRSRRPRTDEQLYFL